MESNTNTEYDKIKILREIQLMKRLQATCKKLEIEECNSQNAKGNVFTPEIIDIITPKTKSFKDLRACDSISSDSEGNKNNY